MQLAQKVVGQLTTSNSPTLERLLERIKVSLRTTPGQLIAALVACIVGTILLSFAVYYAYSDLRQAVQTVGRDTVPSIVAAERINATLADANANGMNALLTGQGDNGLFWKTYQDEMNHVADDLISATQNITYGEEERKPILAMMVKLSQYEQVMGRARGKPVSEGMNDFLAANQIMRQEILPASVALDKVNYSHLNVTYQAHTSHAFKSKLPFYFFTLLLLATLGGTQLFLFRKTQRMLNPGLVVATAVVIVLGLYGISIFSATEANLRTAKADAFDSVHALWQARAAAYDGNADESLYLMFHGNAAAQQKATADYRAKVKLLTAIDPQQALQKANANQKFDGYLGAELANITFLGEKEAALDTLKEWAGYIHIDGQIRDLEGQGRFQEALTLNIGTNPGQSNWAFDKFDKALGRTLDINQQQFTANINNAFKKLDVFPYVLIGSVLIIIVASIWGMKARLDEYRF